MEEVDSQSTWDIRLINIPLLEAEDIIKGFKGQWIYIKLVHNDHSDCAKTNQIGHYSKFKVKTVSISDDVIFIYGSEDDDRLIIYKNDLVRTEGSLTKDEIKIYLINQNANSEIYIKKYLPKMNTRLNEITEDTNHLIITEGKTDWKHLKNALNKFKNNSRYENLDLDFFEYENDVDMGWSTLEKMCDYHALFSNEKLKIFVFDADIEKIIKKHAGVPYKYHGNNVYSLVLPTPKHRKNNPLISIEHYYSDKEMQTLDNYKRRLYLAGEFDVKTREHKTQKNTYALKVKPSTDPIHIEEKVLYVENDVDTFEEIAKRGQNITISKNDFANNILLGVEPFSNISTEVFSIFFDIVADIYKDYIKSNNPLLNENSITLCKGIKINKINNDFDTLLINCSFNKEQLIMLKQTKLFGNKMELSADKKLLYIFIILDSYEIRVSIPISDELIQFLSKKYSNNYNRIELLLYDDTGLLYSSIELFAADVSSVFIEKIIRQL
ncbi:hypothetical protein CBR59_28365 [Bacillus thuringiensis]|uniref:hypothetical protein n=1 Tax=Bacillus thuringiensis TaxID=1428 RepID=UPI000C9E3EC8|nr:hypothetical protein [Bacillus thuringiensis]PNK23352.1 hypothetical protein CBP87_28890 [Bacillus thuringiensis]PNK48072.1 hypothetical protein CBR59_28365 [Bacillus thuringiensis]